MNIEFTFTLIISFFIIYLGVITVFHDRKNATNKLFFLISIITVLWAISNYLSLQPIYFPTIFWSRLVLFFAVPHIFLFYLFIKNFPKSDFVVPKKQFYILSIISLVIMFFTVTPYIFKNLVYKNEIPNPVPGIMMPLFAFFVIFLLLASIILLVRKYHKADITEKRSWGVMLFGFAFSYISIILTNFVLVNTIGDTRFILVAPLLMLPSILGIVYSIKKYSLFNVKAFATELIIFVLMSVSLIQIVLAQSSIQFIFNLSTFLVFLIIGILLIKSVYTEVEHREQLQILTEQLFEANEKLKGLDKLKSEFVSLASHQLRSPLTAIKGYASMLLDGDYGEINPEAKETMNRIFESSQNLAKIVEDLLNVSKIEQGGMKYEMASFDLNEVAESVAKELSIVAEGKGLKMNFLSEGSKDCMVNGDKDKIRQVVLNFIDNSIKYTKTGEINVKVEKVEDKILFSVKDTGMGMTPEIKATLFQKFARGDGARMNTSGTGLGLYLTKEITEAHGGRVYVESEGMGKGSTFFMELNAIK